MLTTYYVMTIYANPEDTTPVEIIKLKDEREVHAKLLTLQQMPDGFCYTLNRIYE